MTTQSEKVETVRSLANDIERDGCCAHRKEAVETLREYAALLVQPQVLEPEQTPKAKCNLNLNSQVTVTLTATGAKRFNDRMRIVPDCCWTRRNAGENLTLPLWDIANTFGDLLFHGNPDLPFKSMNVEILPCA